MPDIAATSKWIMFCLSAVETVPPDDLKADHKEFTWDENKRLAVGILTQRNPSPDKVRWFEIQNAFFGHIGNVSDEESWLRVSGYAPSL
jgi:carotenoid cleavage dioxygenase-like enzyme